MADDAGALLVRLGLVPTNALADARARVASAGGTVGEQLVASSVISDDALTEFYRTRLLVPQVNPNMLARLTAKVIATIPGDMAIELRAVPVSVDGDNNLTVAMSDPSDRHAVDEIAFFTGAYVVRAVATQMQIAWCLAHYYGHVTALGHRLLHTSQQASPIKSALSAASPVPRTKGLTGKVDAARHRAIAPITRPVDVIRPSAGALDLRPLAAASPPAVAASPFAAPPSPPAAPPFAVPPSPPAASPFAAPPSPPAASPFAAPPSPPAASPFAAPPPAVPASPFAAPPPPRPAAPWPAQAAPLATPVTASPAQPEPDPLPAPPSIAGPAVPTAITPGRPTSLSAPPPLTPAVPRPGSTSAIPPAASASASPLIVPPRPPAAALPPLMTPPRSTAVSAPPPVTSALPPRALPTSTPAPSPASSGPVPRAAPDAITLPPINEEPREATATSDGTPDRPRARSISGEIRVPSRRAASIRPPMPADTDTDTDDDEPLIVIEPASTDDDGPGSRIAPPRRRRAVQSDPPELYARAGEVDLKAGTDRAIDADEPRIVIDEDALAPPTGRIDTRATRETTPPVTIIDVMDDADTGALIHDRVVLDRAATPSLGGPQRSMTDQIRVMAAATLATLQRGGTEDDDTGETDVVVLEARKPRPTRPERTTQHGVPPAPSIGRVHHDTEASGVPTIADHRDADRTHRTREIDDTSIDLRAAPPGDQTQSDQLAAPPAPSSADDTNPHVIAPPPTPTGRTTALQRAVLIDDPDDADGAQGDEPDDDDDAGEPDGPRTSVMSSVELDDAIPQRTAEVVPAHLARRHIDYDPVDDGWGPPGTTIPPPLLGAIPGSDDEDDDRDGNMIPMPNVDSSPLIVGPPSQPSAGDSGGRALVRALEDATARAIEVIRQLERTQTRDDVVAVMVAHLAETHHRAGFFVTRHGAAKGAIELGVFSMTPRPAVLPFANLRLDRPSTLQDVVGTRLPYRGPMHDDASRSFLVSVLGACPAEILLVPVAVRERVVGVLFGEHRLRHTFDDQLALAARAAGMALERILKAKRG